MQWHAAHWTGYSGDAPAARERSADLLTGCREALGATHWLTLRITDEMGPWTGTTSDPAAALRLYRDLLGLTATTFGPPGPPGSPHSEA